MHEGSVCVEIMDIVTAAAEANDLSKISLIEVAAGPDSCLQEYELNFYFDVLKKCTIMADAVIALVRDMSYRGISQMYVRGIEGV